MVCTYFCLLMALLPSAARAELSAPTRYPNGATLISSKGDELWVVDNTLAIFRWDGSQWELIPGLASSISATSDGYTWVTGVENIIWRFNKVTRDWETMPGAGTRVSAMSKDRALVVAPDDTIQMWKNGNWTKIGDRALWVALGAQEDAWAINKYDYSIWHWENPSLGEAGWVKKEGQGIQIDSQSPNRVAYRNQAQEVFTLRSDGSWQKIPGKASSLSVGQNGIYAIATKVRAVA